MEEPTVLNVKTATGTQGFVKEAWENILEMAKTYGWNPLGTLPASDSPDDRCNGEYSPGLGQRMTREDSTAFAQALQRAVQDIPTDQAEELGGHVKGSAAVLETMNYFRGRKRAIILRFIKQCESGDVRIFPPGPSWYASKHMAND